MKCFVIAMKKEAEDIISAMQISKDYSLCNKRIVLGKLYGKEIGVVVCGVGKVNAAVGAQLAIDLLKADEIINFGVAGGLNSSVKVGEMYCVADVVQYDFDLTQLGSPLGEVEEGLGSFLPLKSSGIYPAKRLATGDRFNDSPQDNALLTKELRADLRDMECAAIVQTCRHANINCVSFKAVSDIYGNGSTTDQYHENLELCFATLRRELKKIIESI